MVEQEKQEYMKRIQQIPMLPIAYQEILDLLDNQNATNTNIADQIEKNEDLAVKILKTANSVFCNSLTRADSVHRAMEIIGIDEVRAIIYICSIYNFFSDGKKENPEWIDFWKHSIICGQVSKHLGLHFNFGTDFTLFLSGFIHDLGKLVFDQYFHNKFLETVNYVSSLNESFSKGEKEIIGLTHYQVAAQVLQQWKFPYKVKMMVFYHHAPWNDQNFWPETIIIYLADLLTKLAGFPCLPGEKIIDIEEFSNSKIIEYINKSGYQLDEESMSKLAANVRKNIAIESVNMLKFFEER